MDENTAGKIKIAIPVIVTLLMLWAFLRGEIALAMISLILLVIFLAVPFVRQKIEGSQQLDLKDIINKSTVYLENNFKISVGRDRSFKLLDHAPYGDTEYKLVFVRTLENGATEYYPVTIDKTTGKFGESTGVTLKSINEAEYFLRKDVGAPVTKPMSMPEAQAMMQQQIEELEEKIQSKPPNHQPEPRVTQ